MTNAHAKRRKNRLKDRCDFTELTDLALPAFGFLAALEGSLRPVLIPGFIFAFVAMISFNVNF